MGKGTGQAMKYDEESVHNVPDGCLQHRSVHGKEGRGQCLVCDDHTGCLIAIRHTKYPRSQSARCPTKGTQCPHHQVGAYAYGQAQGGQAVV